MKQLNQPSNEQKSNDNENDAKEENQNQNHKSSFKSNIYKTSQGLLTKFVYDLIVGLNCNNVNELRRKLLNRIIEYVEFFLIQKLNIKTIGIISSLTLGLPGPLSILLLFIILPQIRRI